MDLGYSGQWVGTAGAAQGVGQSALAPHHAHCLVLLQVQIDPYLEDSMCQICSAQPGPFFCRDQVQLSLLSVLGSWLWHSGGVLKEEQALFRAMLPLSGGARCPLLGGEDKVVVQEPQLGPRVGGGAALVLTRRQRQLSPRLELGMLRLQCCCARGPGPAVG